MRALLRCTTLDAMRRNWLGKDALTQAANVDSVKTSQYCLIVSKLSQRATIIPCLATVKAMSV